MKTHAEKQLSGNATSATLGIAGTVSYGEIPFGVGTSERQRNEMIQHHATIRNQATAQMTALPVSLDHGCAIDWFRLRLQLSRPVPVIRGFVNRPIQLRSLGFFPPSDHADEIRMRFRPSSDSFANAGRVEGVIALELAPNLRPARFVTTLEVSKIFRTVLSIVPTMIGANAFSVLLHVFSLLLAQAREMLLAPRTLVGLDAFLLTRLMLSIPRLVVGACARFASAMILIEVRGGLINVASAASWHRLNSIIKLDETGWAQS